jgi:GT2 family glycosyltransferase
MKFVLVTPSYNLARFIEQTIYSIIAQKGDFSVRYHIQDGGSKDESRAIFEKWESLLSNHVVPILCRDLSFSFEVASDNGMYDAINRGFARARDEEPCIMSWINGDDFLLPGSLAAVSAFFQQYTSAQLVGGRTALACPDGFLTVVAPPRGFQREDIACGLHDGRSKSFIMQEGTFWRSELWDKVGGIDSKLRYAGDFDLWRRFAKHTEYHVLDTITAYHRKRSGQLSADLSSYNAEVDAVMAGEVSNAVIKDPVGWFAYEPASKAWVHYEPRLERWRGLIGVSDPEGPFPSIGLERACWVTSTNAQLAIKCETGGKGRLLIAFRNPFDVRTVDLAGVRRNVRQSPMEKRMILSVPFYAHAGWNAVDLKLDRLASAPGDSRTLGIFLESLEFSPRSGFPGHIIKKLFG